jgi:hypothetical protein
LINVLALIVISLHPLGPRFHGAGLFGPPQLPESEIANPPPDGSGTLPLVTKLHVDQWMLIPPGAPLGPAQMRSVMLDGVELTQVIVGASSLQSG